MSIRSIVASALLERKNQDCARVANSSLTSLIVWIWRGERKPNSLENISKLVSNTNGKIRKVNKIENCLATKLEALEFQCKRTVISRNRLRSKLISFLFFNLMINYKHTLFNLFTEHDEISSIRMKMNVPAKWMS